MHDRTLIDAAECVKLAELDSSPLFLVCRALCAVLCHAVSCWTGWVQTDMGNAGARALKLAEAPMKFEDSITKIVQLLDTATRESHGGKYWNVETDSELPW